MKRVWSWLLTLALFTAVLRCFAATSAATIYELVQCKKILAYSGSAHAYFYGCDGSTLVSARVLPDISVKTCRAPGVIRAVCHDESNAYALYEESRGRYGVLALRMDSGAVDTTALQFDGEIQAVSFAVSRGEVFLLMNDRGSSYVLGLRGGNATRYTAQSGAEQLFINGGEVYAQMYSGEIYRVGQGKLTFCLRLAAHSRLVNAGNGYVYSDGVLTGLNGSTLSCGTAFAVKTDSGVYTCGTEAMAVAAVGNRAAVLLTGYSCEYKTVVESSAAPQATSAVGDTGAQDAGDGSDGDIGVLTAGTTVSQLKKAFPTVTAVTDADGDEVTSGAVRTGYIALFQNGSRALSVSGDLNGSGTVNSADVRFLMEHFVKGSDISDCVMQAADLNRDGLLDNRDLVLLSRATA